MARTLKKWLAMCLVVCMCMSMFTIQASAEGTEPDSSSTITGTITGDTEWNDGDVVGPLTISGGTQKNPITITVNGTVTVDGQITIGGSDDCYVVFKGNGMLIRGTNNGGGAVIWVQGNNRIWHSVTVDGVTLDGGAVWDGDDIHETLDRDTTNVGVKATGSNSCVLFVRFADVTLKDTVLQNQDGNGGKGCAVNLGYSKLFIEDSVVCNNYYTANRGGAIHMRNGSTVIAKDSEFFGNHGAQGGVIGTSSSSAYASVMEFTNCSFNNNYSNDAGAVFHTQDNQNYGYLKVIGCTIEDNSCATANRGIVDSSSYTVPVYFENCTISGNDCNLFGYFSNENKNLFVSGSDIISAYEGTLSAVPFNVYGALDEMLLNEKTIKHLMDNYGYIATEAEGYSITAADVAQMLGENAAYIKADVDGNGTLDIVPGTVDETNAIKVTVVDCFPGSEDSEEQTIYADQYPTCTFAHSGYDFNGWVKAENNVWTAQWRVAKPDAVIVSSSAYSVEGVDTEYTLSVDRIINRVDSATYSYQWLLDESEIEGATEPIFTTCGGDLGWHHYTCEVTANNPDADIIETVASNTVRVKVLPEPQIEDDHVCYIEETGVGYETLTEAVDDANALGSATIVMLKSIDFDSDEALPITSDVTIIGEYTISRGDYAGTLFEVSENAALTLDGGLIIDGGNNWAFDKDTYEADRDSMTQVKKEAYRTEVDGKVTYKYVSPAEGAPVVTDHMILVGNNGAVNLNNVTIQNEYGQYAGVVRSNGVSTGASAHVTLDGAKITHIASMQGNGVVVHKTDGKNTVEIVMDAGTVIDGNYVGGNHGLFKLYNGSVMTMNGGEITNTIGWNANGVVVGIYGAGSEFIMNGGLICGSSSIWGEDNARHPAVYPHASGKLVMNGGMICHNIGKEYAGGIGSYKSSSDIVINGGLVVDNKSLNNENRTGEYVERGDDVDVAYDDVMVIYGGIYTHDVSKWCAPGYVSLPYDRDMSAYCDTSYAPKGYNENDRDNDFIVVPGYKVTYHTVDTKDVTNAETGEQTTEIVTNPVHEEFLLIPKDKTYNEVDLFATPYSHRNSDNTKEIKTWYTKCELNSENKVALSEQFDFDKTEVVSNLDLYGNTWDTVSTGGNTGTGSGNTRPSGGSSSSSSTKKPAVIEDEKVPLAGGPMGLNTVDHIAYLAGFGDGTLRPYDGITRGQVATIFYRLLTDEARAEFWSETNNFTDCGEDLWCNTAISTLSNMGIISGYEDGTFRPNVKVTRAQFAKIMVGFFGVDQLGYTGLFSDVAEDAWHSQYVETASRLGLIQGYNNGTFKPNANITRAQACVIVNRALVRVPDEEHLLPLDKMLTWTDNTPDDWFYADMMEATNSHDYMWLNTETDIMEQWTEKLDQPDWAKLEKIWSETYGG